MRVMQRSPAPAHVPDGLAQAGGGGTVRGVSRGGRAAGDPRDQGRHGPPAPRGSGAIQLARQKGNNRSGGQQLSYKERKAAQQAQSVKARAPQEEAANAKKAALEKELKAQAEREKQAKAKLRREAEVEKQRAAVESEFRRHEDIARLLETPANVCVAVVPGPLGLLAAANKGVIGTFGWVPGTVTVSQNVEVETTEEPLKSTARKLDAYLQSGPLLAQAVGSIQQVHTGSDQVHAEMKLLNYMDQNPQQFPGAVELYISRICCANCSAAIDIWNRWKAPKVTVRKASSASRWPGWAKPAWMTQHNQANAEYDLWAQQWQQHNQGFTDVTGLSTRRPRSDSDPISRVQTTIALV
jgi:hypothetical protein